MNEAKYVIKAFVVAKPTKEAEDILKNVIQIYLDPYYDKELTQIIRECGKLYYGENSN